MPRSIPPLLASLVELLELDRPQIVTIGHLGTMLHTLELHIPPAKAAYQLRKRGWLLPTGVRGAYEFAPGDRAGPISQADALINVRAVLSTAPDIQIAATFGTALALQNIADRGPDIPELALPKDQRIPRPLQNPSVRVLHFDWSLPPILIQGIPVLRPATVLVHLAYRPTDVRSWAAILEALPQLVAASPLNDIAQELEGRPRATGIRLAYLTQGVAPTLARALKIVPAGKTWFGPRGPLKRHDATWNVADTILPFAPRTLIPATAPDEASDTLTPEP